MFLSCCVLSYGKNLVFLGEQTEVGWKSANRSVPVQALFPKGPVLGCGKMIA